MASVLQFFNIKKKSEVTPVARLGINSPLYTLQKKSETYFTVAEEAMAADNNQLAITTRPGQAFKLDNEPHKMYLDECVALFKRSSASLKAIDMKITTGVIVGVVATTLSFLPLMGCLSLIGWGAAIYYMNKRAVAYMEYQESLKLLVATCNWSLGPNAEERVSPIDGLTQDASLRAMMAALYPVLSEDQVKHLIADDIEGVFVNEFKAYEAKLTAGFDKNKVVTNAEANLALSKKGAEFKRCLYGFNRGGVVDFLDALASALPDLYHAASTGFQQLKYWLQEKFASDKKPVVEQELETATPKM